MAKISQVERQINPTADFKKKGLGHCGPEGQSDLFGENEIFIYNFELSLDTLWTRDKDLHHVKLL